MRKLEDLPLVKAQLKEPPPKAAMERSFFSVSELIERLTRRHVRHTILAPWVSTKEIAGSEDARPAAYLCFGTLHAPQCATQVFFSWEFTCAPRYRPNRNNSFAYSPTRTTEPSPHPHQVYNPGWREIPCWRVLT